MNFRSKQKVEQAARALVELGTMKQAAGVVGLTDRTLRTWAKTPEFQEAVADAKAEAIAETGRKLAGASGQAVDVLIGVMKAPKVAKGAGTRIRAAVAILNALVTVSQFADLDARIRALEERQ